MIFQFAATGIFPVVIFAPQKTIGAGCGYFTQYPFPGTRESFITD
jgi:hypothetical protein